MATRTLALVGAAGGVGTTRLTVETGAILARTGRDVVIFDASFATQGLESFVERTDRDVTDLVTGNATLEETLYDLSLDMDGRMAVCPASASFQNIARAKAATASERFRDQLAAASLTFDVVLVDVPPLATNQALAAIETVRQIALITVDTERGALALDSQLARLDDVGIQPDTTFCNHADDGPVVADAVVPTVTGARDHDCPWTDQHEDTPFGRAMITATEMALDVSLDIARRRPGIFRRLVSAV